MNIDGFTNKHNSEFLGNFRPLQGWEQLHIIYHSNCPLRKKRVAYEQLLSEFKNDHDLAKHLHRHICLIDDALAAPQCAPSPGTIYLAFSEITVVDEYGCYKERYSEGEKYFSTYAKAKSWLDAERYKAEVDEWSVCTSQRVIELVLDSNEEVGCWDFDNNGEVYAFTRQFDEEETYHSMPEHQYIDFPGLYQSGDILLRREPNGQINKDDYAVAPHGYEILPPNVIAVSDASDMCVFVMRYNAEKKTVWHDHWSLWNTEEVRFELPPSHSILYEISSHFSGSHKLEPQMIKALDPYGFFQWENVHCHATS